MQHRATQNQTDTVKSKMTATHQLTLHPDSPHA